MLTSSLLTRRTGTKSWRCQITDFTPMSEVDPKRQVARAKNIASAYTLTNLLKAENYMDQLIELLVTRLGQLADAQKPVEFDKWFNYMAFDIVGELAFSSPFGFLESARI